MSKLKKLKFILIIISIVLASVYLTFLIDTQTLNTWLKRIFVFCYFFVISGAVFYLYNKKCNCKYTLLPLLLAIVTVSFGQSFFIPVKSDRVIYVQAVETSYEGKDVYREAWLVDVSFDGKAQRLSDLVVNDKSGWSYGNDYDDYFFRPTGSDESNLLSFNVVGEEVILVFGANTWSGDVNIFDDNGYSHRLSLYSEDAQNDRLEHRINISVRYSILESALYNAGAVAVVCFANKLVFWGVCHFIYKFKSKNIPAEEAKK